ncbi:uncharacterized protein F5891DRAFT_1190439 [Suillus fuscotomentosus]|uniref:Uncharacterized protein n=1 Tax=Suillus fuscotomentosus TaxID=1912939 RepID=A0AAD4E556_9AGAM|nr:uncharacterized protein F5891DRAFT_1190439 [Suillus fuscotomentosus]KAG1898669.1 hypothetical protein F5891DRAFT_1190439 [Suillus fuscotomentosus]
MEQFIEAIHLVQNGHVPLSSPRPYAWPYQPEDQVCPVHAQRVLNSSDDNSTDIEDNSSNVKDNSSDVSIDDLWIGSEMVLADNGFKSSSSNEGDNEAESDTSAETLVDLDPASHFDWFVTTRVVGVGLFSEIITARMLRAPGTTVHYFVTLREAMQHFCLALAMWNGETV